jgi:hypothetical protein
MSVKAGPTAARGPILLPGGGRRSTIGLPLPLPTRPALVLGLVLALLVLLPTNRLPTKVSWALLVLLLALVVNAAVRHADRMRIPAVAVALLLSGLCATLSAQRYGSLQDVLVSAATALLLAGCALLAAHCSRADRDLLVGVIVLLGLLELAVAAASAFLGVRAPWGYLGQRGSVFGVNELLPVVGGRTTGTMGHPLPFSTLLAVAAVLALFAVPRWRLPSRLVLAAACWFGVLLSGSRSTALVLVLALLFGALWPGVSRSGVVGRIAVVALVTGVALRVDVRELPVLTSLEDTGSLTHRLGALDAVGRLGGRSTTEVLFGSGQGSLGHLFGQGLLQTDGFLAVDNQLVTTFATGGAVAVSLLLLAVLVGLFRGDRTTRAAALVPVLMFFSFDVLQWSATAVLLAVLVGLGTSAARLAEPPVPGPAAQPAPTADRSQASAASRPSTSGRSARTEATGRARSSDATIRPASSAGGTPGASTS